MYELTRTKVLALALYGSVSVTALGCGDTTKAAASASSTAAAPPASSVSSADKVKTAAPAETAKPVELVDHDLSSADPKWAGWSAKGPADAKVMADGVAGARLAAKGPSLLDRKPGSDEGFDIAFAWGKDDLASLKSNLKKGADDSKSTLTFTKDEADRLEYTRRAKTRPRRTTS